MKQLMRDCVICGAVIVAFVSAASTLEKASAMQGIKLPCFTTAFEEASVVNDVPGAVTTKAMFRIGKPFREDHKVFFVAQAYTWPGMKLVAADRLETVWIPANTPFQQFPIFHR
jgi:hypothetical protein